MQLTNKPVIVKGKKLLTSAQIALNTIKSSPLVGTKIAIASNNAGTGTVEAHCTNPIALPSSGVDVRYNELMHTIAKLTEQNNNLLATIGILTHQTTTPLPVPVIERTTIQPVVVHNKEYCDVSMLARFNAIITKIIADGDHRDNSRYGVGNPFPHALANKVWHKIDGKIENAKLHALPVKTLELIESAYASKSEKSAYVRLR